VGDIAYRLNLLSAVCAALAVGLVGLLVAETLGEDARHRAGTNGGMWGLIWPCAAVASLSLAFSGAFWSQAVIGEVYALNALFAALLLYGLSRLRPDNRGWLIPALFGLLGLGLGNHPTLLLLAPLLIGRLTGSDLRGVRHAHGPDGSTPGRAGSSSPDPLTGEARWRLAGTSLAALCLGLAVYLVIPLRAATHPPVNWGAAATWPNLAWLVSGEPYRQFVFGLPWQFVPARLLVELRLLADTFMGWGLPVGLLGLARLGRSDRSLAWSSLAAFGLLSLYAIGYDTTDSYVYLLPAWLLFALWLGWGLYALSEALRRVTRARWARSSLAGWGLLLLPLLALAWNLPGQNLSRDWEAYDYAQRSLELVAPQAVIVVESDPETFALWYARYGLAMRPDVAPVSTNLLPYAWYREALRRTHPRLRLTDQAGRPLTSLSTLIEMNVCDSPLYLGSLQAAEMEGYGLEPAGALRRVVKVNDLASIDIIPVADTESQIYLPVILR
jgi:hypothetical protein